MNNNLLIFIAGVIIGIIICWNVSADYTLHKVWSTSGPCKKITVDDVDNDGFNEVIIDENIYKTKGDNYYEKLSQLRGHPTLGDVAIGDVDNDGKKEIVVVGGMMLMPKHIVYGGVRIFKIENNTSYKQVWYDGRTGDLLAGSNKSTTIKNFASSVKIADIDLDGINEILVGSWDGNIYIFKNQENYTCIGYIDTSVCYIDEQFVSFCMKNEEVMNCKLSLDSSWVFDCDKGVRCLNDSVWSPVGGFSFYACNGSDEKVCEDVENITVCDNDVNNIILEDIDRDKYLEIIAATQHGIFIYEYDGKNYIQVWNSTSILKYSSNIAIADVDNDGEKEI